MKKATKIGAMGVVAAALLLPTVYLMPNGGGEVEAQAVFQLTGKDIQAATQAVQMGDSTEVFGVVNACFAKEEVRNAVKAEGFASVLKAKMEKDEAHNTKVRELAQYVKGGYLKIEVDGVSIPLDRMSINDAVLQISKPVPEPVPEPEPIPE